MSIMQRIADARSNSRKDSWDGPFDVNIEETGKTQRFERSRNTDETKDYNDRLRAWGEKVKGALPDSISSHSIKGSKLSNSIKNTYYKEFGEIYRLGFSFAREGIFVHKGVGRGYVMRGTSVVKTAKTEGFNRKEKPWFNPVVASFIPELEQIIVEHTDSAVINSSRIFIR